MVVNKGNHSSQKPSSESGVQSAAEPFLEGHCLPIGYGGLRVRDEMGGSFKPYLFFCIFSCSIVNSRGSIDTRIKLWNQTQIQNLHNVQAL